MKTRTGVNYELKWIENRLYFIIDHPKFKNPVCARNDNGFTTRNGEEFLSTYQSTRYKEYEQKHIGAIGLGVCLSDKETILAEIAKQDEIIAAERKAESDRAAAEEKRIAEKVGGYFYAVVHESGEYSSSITVAKCRKPDYETENWNKETVTAVTSERLFEISWKVYDQTRINATQKDRERYTCGWNTVMFVISESEIDELKQAITDYETKIEAEKARVIAEKEAKEKAIFDEAKTTGKPVVLASYTDDCNDPREECSCDQVVVYANPDGSKTTKRWHTY